MSNILLWVPQTLLAIVFVLHGWLYVTGVLFVFVAVVAYARWQVAPL